MQMQEQEQVQEQVQEQEQQQQQPVQVQRVERVVVVARVGPGTTARTATDPGRAPQSRAECAGTVCAAQTG